MINFFRSQNLPRKEKKSHFGHNKSRKVRTTYLMSEECGLKHWIGRLPRISYKTHELSSCPDTINRPDGSTQTAATGEP